MHTHRHKFIKGAKLIKAWIKLKTVHCSWLNEITSTCSDVSQELFLLKPKTLYDIIIVYGHSYAHKSLCRVGSLQVKLMFQTGFSTLAAKSKFNIYHLQVEWNLFNLKMYWNNIWKWKTSFIIIKREAQTFLSEPGIIKLVP